MSIKRHYLDVTEHPKTANRSPEFYRNYISKYAKPYVRLVPPAKKRDATKKLHQENKAFGLICVENSCSHGDVHRHPEQEVRLDV